MIDLHMESPRPIPVLFVVWKGEKIASIVSGKQGYAVAEAARDRGASVTLVSAPTALTDPVGVDMVKVRASIG